MNNTRGFSLAETVIYVSLIAMLVFAVVNVLIVSISMYRNFDAARNIQDGALAVVDRIVSESRNASVVNVAGSTLDSISMTNTSGDIIQFSVLDGAVHVFRNGNDIGPLTPKGVTVAGLAFRYSENPISELVKMEMVLRAGTGESMREESFYTSIVLRGSYRN